MIYFILLIVVILEAVEDGLREKGKKTWSKRTEGFYKVLLIYVPCFFTIDLWEVHSWTQFVATAHYLFVVLILWIFIRTYLFDPVMHLISGWSVNTVGITSPLYDKIMKNLPGWKTWVWRGFWLFLSIFWYYKAVLNF